MKTIKYQSYMSREASCWISGIVSSVVSLAGMLFYAALWLLKLMRLWPKHFDQAIYTARLEVSIGMITLAIGTVFALFSLRRRAGTFFVLLAWLLVALNLAYWIWMISRVHSLYRYTHDA